MAPVQRLPFSPLTRFRFFDSSPRFTRPLVLCAAVSRALVASVWAGDPAAAAPDFTREVRPILANHCFACHGMDEAARKADLRLDDRQAALDSGALKPGDPDGSEMFRRLVTHDPEELMPPPDAKKPLTPEQVEIVRRWIAGGARYAGHWAFEPPVKHPVPPAPEGARVYDPLDAFVADRLHREGLTQAPEASKETWLRRATLDLTGLPPTLEELDAFLADETPEAYARAADRLLASPAYGEHMAAAWLDTARYGDTYGRHEDADCPTWPYRDWVIRAFNNNLPWDQFILHQTAGDLLPNPTLDQLIATGFNRLPQQSNEAGSETEEFRIEQVADRVRTNGLAFMGMTFECARCHDHKFDPVTMKDYYAMSAFFNNIDELGLFAVYTGGTPPPSILLFTPEDQAKHEAAKRKIEALEKRLEEERPAAEARFAEWLQNHKPPKGDPWVTLKRQAERAGKPVEAMTDAALPPRAPVAYYQFEEVKSKQLRDEIHPDIPGSVRNNAKLAPGRLGQSLLLENDNSVRIESSKEVRRTDPFSFGLWIWPKKELKRGVIVHRSRAGIDAAGRGFDLTLEDGHLSFGIVHFSPGNEIRLRTRDTVPLNAWTHLAATYDGSSRAAGMAIYINGERAECEVVRDNLYRDIVYRADWGDDTGKDAGGEMRGLITTFLGFRTNDAAFHDGMVDEFQLFDCCLTVPEVRQIALRVDTSKKTDWLEWYLREVDEPWRALAAELRAAREEENELSGRAVDYMVMEDMPGPRRPTHVLKRGQWNQPGEEVEPSTPSAILPFDPSLPKNRLGFARWMLDARHPLTARVAVNRIWQNFFGRGLVATPEDFGIQGQPPSHPELLDWLAVEFREGGWDVKALCKRIVLSATYRQSAVPADRETLARDPDNVLLARGPRGRLPGEILRDAALAASGLLVRKIGGPSVKPYQPEGLWEEAGTQHTYVQDHGEALYRRSLYTFWRRSLPPPSMTVFDAPTREFCTVRREKTNTPLQTLVLMNDPQFVEAARVLAEKLVREHPDDPAARVRVAWRTLTGVWPDAERTNRLVAFMEAERERAAAEPEKTKALLEQNGERPPDPALPAAQVAAATHLVRLLFNFSETITKP